MKRVAVGYGRFSTDMQRKESLDAQLRAIESYAESIGYSKVIFFSDSGISGKTDKRPGFQEAIAYAIENDVKAFIVHKLDRFSRSKLHSVVYRDKLEKSNVKLLSVTEKLNDSPEGVLMESIYEGLSQFYSANLSREVMKGLKENALKAQFNGGVPPLGYDIDSEKHYVVNESEALIVRMIFHMILEGNTYGEIINECNHLGYRTKRNETFGKNSIHSILKNEKYKGVYTFNKAKKRKSNGSRNSHSKKNETDIIRVEGGVPVIIDVESFDKVQEIMKGREINGASSKAKEIYLLQGIIFCGECGSAMHGNRRKTGSGGPYITYRCGKKEHKKICSNREIKRDVLEECILNLLENNLFSKENIKLLIKKINDSMKSRLERKSDVMRMIQNEIKQSDIKIENILKAIENGSTHEALFSRLDAIQNQKDKLELDLFRQNELNKIDVIDEDEIRELFSKFKLTLENQDRKIIKEVIRKFVKRVDVYEDRVEIIFNAVLSLVSSLEVPFLEELILVRKGVNLTCDIVVIPSEYKSGTKKTSLQKSEGFVVPKAGIEPARPEGLWILSPARLPVPPFRHGNCVVKTRNMIP